MLTIIVALVIVIVVLFCLWQGKLPPSAVSDMANGIVPGNPADLAAAKGVDLEQYSLARVAQSEEGISSDRAKIAVMYAVLNKSRAAGKTITALVTAGNQKRADYAQANGHYGRQGMHPYCSSVAEPTAHVIDLAAEVMSGSADDETQGAQYWDNPILQAAQHLAKPYNETTHEGYRSPDEIATRRQAAGLTQVDIPGVTTRFWAAQ